MFPVFDVKGDVSRSWKTQGRTVAVVYNSYRVIVFAVCRKRKA